MTDDDFADYVKQQILDAYGFESEAELNAAIEKKLPGYLAAHAEWEAEKAAFSAEIQDRLGKAQQAVAAFLRDRGLLPDGVELELTPMNLQADAQWMARAPGWWAKGESIVVDYVTDRPLVPLDPDAPELTEEQKQAAAEAATEQIERWQQQWDAGALNYDVPPMQWPPYPRLSDHIPRSRDYPAGG